MTLPTTSIRADVKKRLFDLVVAQGLTRVDGSPLQVLYSRNDRLLQNECVYFGAVKGNQDNPILGTPTRRNDVFTIDVWIVVRVDGLDDTDTGGAYTADVTCQTIAAGLESVLRTTPGVGSTGAGSLMDGIHWVQLAQVDGPDFGPFVDLLSGQTAGYASVMRLVPEVHVRLS